MPIELVPYAVRATSLALGLDPDKPIESRLGETLLSDVEMGLEQILDIFRNSANDSALKMVDRWNRLSISEREYCTLDQLIASVKMSPAEALGMIASELYSQQASVATLIAAINTPKVMKATIDAAMSTKFGHADRKMLLQSSGNAIVPKSTTTVNNIRDSRFVQQNNQINLPSLGEAASIIDALDIE